MADYPPPSPPMLPDPEWPSDDVLPTPWTRAEIEEYDRKYNTVQPGGAQARLDEQAADQARLSQLRTKGAARMTPAEKDEALDLMLRGAR